MSDSPENRVVPAKALHDIANVARVAGVSSRTLRYYESIGLLVPTGFGGGGTRRYDDRALVRLQRILVFRSLGVGLQDIRRLLDAEADDLVALTMQLGLLERERDRVARQLAAVRTTLRNIRDGVETPVLDMFDGFSDGVV